MTNKSLYRMIFTALMAAIVYVTTLVFKVTIPTPAGPTMLKVGNAFCLFSGMLLGPAYGGLAAGIGSMLFDLSDPMFAPSAPYTLVFFFAMGCVCGLISHTGGARGTSVRKNMLGGLAGAAAYYVLNIGKSVILLILAGSQPWAAVVANSAKMVTSLVNAAIAVALSVILAKLLMGPLQKNGLLDKLQ